MSGIYIPGMEMPNGCYYCALKTDWGTCGYYSISKQIAGRDVPYNEYEERREDCPLVPVPPHGRLIDADAQIDWLYDDEPSPWKAPFRLCTADRSDVKFLLKNAPTIIPAEEGE